METVVTTSPFEAAAFVRAGQLAAFPTETVYGLGADAFQPDAVKRVFAAKERPIENPLIVHVSELAQIDDVAVDVPSYARRLIESLFPGPLTLVLRRHRRVPSVVSGGRNSIAVRMPDLALARTFLIACGTPVAAPSANRSGRPSPTTWQAVLEDMDGRISCILQGGRATIGLESTVVDCTNETPILLRAGAMSIDALSSIVPTVRAASQEDITAGRSPGLRHRHYAPRARVRPVQLAPANPVSNSAYIGTGIPPNPDAFDRYLVCRDTEEYAYELFDFFRSCDAAGVKTIYCEVPQTGGLGAALEDRVRRASLEGAGDEMNTP